MSKTALVLQHAPGIHLGNLEPVLREHGYEIRVVDASAEELTAIDPSAADLLVVLGGEMGVYESRLHPFLNAELALIRARLDAERPVFGVCLGAQLMAGALGERVYKGESAEIGFRTVTPTAAGDLSPVRHIAGVPVLQWHGDTFDLPERATLLASSADYGNQAFRIDDWALAVQFHPEATDEMQETWIRDAGETVPEPAASVPERVACAEPRRSEGAVDADAMRRERTVYSAAMQEASRRLFGEWLEALPT